MTTNDYMLLAVIVLGALGGWVWFRGYKETDSSNF
jgi:hypothetical protein